MADNIANYKTSDATTLVGTFGCDDIGGILYVRQKLIIGQDGTNDGDVSSANPLPTLLRSEQVDDAAFTPATSRVMMIGATFDDVAPDSVSEGDGGALRMSANRCVYVNLRDNAGNERGLNIDANGALAATTTGNVAHDAADSGNPGKLGGYASAAAPTDVSGDADRVNAWFLRNGSLATQPVYAGVLALAGNGASGTGVQRVTIANDSTGILAGVTTVTTVTTCATVTSLVGSSIAHDAADSGNPHKIGAKATASVLGETLVAANDRTDLRAGLDGVLITRPHCSLEDCLSDRSTNTDGASTAFTGALAATASQRIYLTSVAFANSSATPITVDIRDGASGSILWTMMVPAGIGVSHTFPTPLRFTANTAVAYDGSAAVTTLTASACGFKAKA